MPKQPPWDIYVDERKVPRDHWLGFLIVPNTASFMHKLHRCRENSPGQPGRFEARELHWHRLHRTVLALAEHWFDRLFQHQGAAFRIMRLHPGVRKDVVVVDFLRRFCRAKRLHAPFDVVVFLDFESSHAPARIQNAIREAAQVSRCYHVDSAKNDCIQLTDLLLGATLKVRNDPTVALALPGLRERRARGERLSDSECKQYLAGFLDALRQQNDRKVRILDP